MSQSPTPSQDDSDEHMQSPEPDQLDAPRPESHGQTQTQTQTQTPDHGTTSLVAQTDVQSQPQPQTTQTHPLIHPGAAPVPAAATAPTPGPAPPPHPYYQGQFLPAHAVPFPDGPPPHISYGPPPEHPLVPSERPVQIPPFEPRASSPPRQPGDYFPPAAYVHQRRRGPRVELYPDLARLRALGSELGRTRPDNGRMSGEMRAAVLAAVAAGLPKAVVADCFNVGRRTVNITINRFANQGTNRDKPRSGRPRKLSDTTERAIAVAANDTSATALAKDHGVSVRTIKRIRRDYEGLDRRGTGGHDVSSSVNGGVAADQGVRADDDESAGASTSVSASASASASPAIGAGMVEPVPGFRELIS